MTHLKLKSHNNIKNDEYFEILSNGIENLTEITSLELVFIIGVDDDNNILAKNNINFFSNAIKNW